MIKLFFDIETIPCDEDKREVFLEIVKKKKKMIAEEVDESLDDKIHHDSGFDGAFGRICCIGYIKEGDETTKGVLKGNEKEILEQFWGLVKNVDVFIGHNVWEFDLPFIYQRSVVLGVKPSKEVSFVRYRHDSIYDTMKEWSKWGFGNSIKLDTLAKVLDFPTSKDEMDGSEVWDYFRQGKIDEICKYCMKDVELTRKVFYRMIFEQLPTDTPELETPEELF